MNGVSISAVAARPPGASAPARYREAFIFGEENRQPRCVIDLVADAPGVYNPLVLFGPSGTGKSHLLLALAAEFTARDPQAKVVLLRAGDLPGDYADEDNARLARLKAAHRSADLLILEDLQQLAGRPAAQQDALLLLDAVIDRGGQAAVSLPFASLPLDDFAPRLVSRLAGGLAVPVRPPDLNSRLELLTRLAEQMQVPLANREIAHLAKARPGTALELHGLLKTLAARHSALSHHTLTHHTLTHHTEPHALALGTHNALPVRIASPSTIRPADVARLLAETAPRGGVTLTKIASTVSRYFAVRIADLRGSSRHAGVVLARGAAIYLARELTRRSLSEVGRFFGGRDHTTALYNVRQVKARSKSDPAFARAVAELRERLQPKEC